MTLPFAHLNLARNPFGELDPHERAALAVVDPALAAWVRPGRALQIVAPCGRGKTTHLLALAARIEGATYVRARRDPVPEAHVLVLDEADALWPWQRWRAYRGAAALVVANHHGRAAELRLAGFTVRTVRPRADASVVATAFAARIAHCRERPGPVPALDAGEIAALVARHGDDVRAMEAELYDRFQRQRFAEVA